MNIHKKLLWSLAFACGLLFLAILTRMDLILPATLLPDVSCNGEEEDCSVAIETINALPKCRQYIHSLSIDYSGGLGAYTNTYGDVSIPGEVPLEQIRSLLIHECGHVIDFFSLRGNPRNKTSAFTVRTLPTFSDDPSLKFYTLSWNNQSTKKTGWKEEDFVSAYAQENVMEDFAESYTYYVLQKGAFEKRAKTNAVLKKKLVFVRSLFPRSFNIAISPAWNGLIPPSVIGVSYEWRASMKASAK